MICVWTAWLFKKSLILGEILANSVFLAGMEIRASLAMAFLAADHHFLNFSSPTT